MWLCGTAANNDTSFFKSNLEIVVADPHRPGHEVLYYPEK